MATTNLFKPVTMPSMRRACVIALLPLLLASARADDKPDLQTILDAWKAREKNVESFDFRWWSKRLESRDENRPANYPAQINWAPRPENDSIWRYRFVVDSRNRYLYEQSGRDWNPESGTFVPIHYVEVSDGKLLKYFYDKGQLVYPLLIVKEDRKDLRLVRDTWADPIKMVFRPSSFALGTFDPKNLVLVNETEMIDNHRVLVLRDEKQMVWVDPANGNLPVRWTSTSGDYRADVAYEPDEIVGWVPHSWTIKQPHDLETATVTQFAINKPIVDSTFELDLSGGAIVQDWSKRPMTLSINYPDGKQRLVTTGELGFKGKNFQELLKSEPDSK